MWNIEIIDPPTAKGDKSWLTPAGCRQVAAKGRVLSRFQDLSEGLPAVEQIVYFASPLQKNGDGLWFEADAFSAIFDSAVAAHSSSKRLTAAAPPLAMDW